MGDRRGDSGVRVACAEAVNAEVEALEGTQGLYSGSEHVRVIRVAAFGDEECKSGNIDGAARRRQVVRDEVQVHDPFDVNVGIPYLDTCPLIPLNIGHIPERIVGR